MRAAFAAFLLLPAVAFAKIPDPRFSTVDPVLYGDTQGTRTFRVVIRDVSNAPSRARKWSSTFPRRTCASTPCRNRERPSIALLARFPD